jgi:hypothetical protein
VYSVPLFNLPCRPSAVLLVENRCAASPAAGLVALEASLFAQAQEIRAAVVEGIAELDEYENKSAELMARKLCDHNHQ